MDALWILSGVATLAILGWFLTARALSRLRKQLRALDSQKRSQSTRYGQITEQFAPFMANWPWDPKRFKFLGDPIDGIQFTDDGIVLVEIKTNKSRLTAVQRQARDHVLAGRVEWREVRID
ncbi:MAG: Holliday junction resolvase-like protein [Thermoplasmatota archaeon]